MRRAGERLELNALVEGDDKSIRDHRRIRLDIPADRVDVGEHRGALVALNLGVIVAVDAGNGREQWQLLPVDGKAVEGASVTLADFQGRKSQECSRAAVLDRERRMRLGCHTALLASSSRSRRRLNT